MESSAKTAPPGRLLTFASGGWVLLLTALFFVLVLVIVLLPVMRAVSQRPPGDGKDPHSFGFDLAHATMPVEAIVPAMLHRDLVRPLDDPATMSATGVDEQNEVIRGKYIVPDALVVGVVEGGEARAYPLLVLGNHEVINDTLGGRPIAVTYSPLTGSAAVFDRRVAGETVTFGISGLVHDSNHLLYDRRDGAGESLWGQLRAAAVTGPAAEQQMALERVPAAVMRWSDWRERHPETTVPRFDELTIKRYRELDYAGYARSGDLRFPTEPLPSTERHALKTPCVAVFAGGQRRLYPLPDLLEAAGADGTVRDSLGGTDVTFRVTQGPLTALVTVGDTDELADCVYAYWFAWYAQDPEVDIYTP
jgi:hypothetical protein